MKSATTDGGKLKWTSIVRINAYGDVGEFREGVRGLGFDYALDVKVYTRMVIVCDDGEQTDPMSVATVSEIIGANSYRKIIGRQGTKRARGPRSPRAIPQHEASRPHQLLSWDITCLPTVLRGRFFFLYMFMDVWSRRLSVGRHMTVRTTSWQRWCNVCATSSAHWPAWSFMPTTVPNGPTPTKNLSQ